ncbi:MAG: polyphosphate kinase 2, partial [Flavobacteriaceae bacterium]|nr:polyphosphate kinase 2 [Flavobacteriaceae bacterium]
SAQELWDEYTFYKDKMFAKVKDHQSFKIIRANRKTSARIAVIEHILDSIPYDKSIKI